MLSLYFWIDIISLTNDENAHYSGNKCSHYKKMKSSNETRIIQIVIALNNISNEILKSVIFFAN